MMFFTTIWQMMLSNVSRFFFCWGRCLGSSLGKGLGLLEQQWSEGFINPVFPSASGAL